MTLYILNTGKLSYVGITLKENYFSLNEHISYSKSTF